MAKGKRTPIEEKQKAVARVRRGESLEAVAKDYNISVSTLSDWGKVNGRSPKRKVATRTAPRKNPLKVENENLKRQVEFWRDKYTSLLSESEMT